mmetsp:Transcript_7740/g.11494  ORF Transcript_7740/g.11494 Transcript_7740/m.11494 type:complete len:130 (+) Transcript_7740:2506-2895(+)
MTNAKRREKVKKNANKSKNEINMTKIAMIFIGMYIPKSKKPINNPHNNPPKWPAQSTLGKNDMANMTTKKMDMEMKYDIFSRWEILENRHIMLPIFAPNSPIIAPDAPTEILSGNATHDNKFPPIPETK